MKELLDRVDAHIRAAEFGSARQLLGRLNLRQIPREHVVRVSSLARRCGSIPTSLRLLNPIVRDRRTSSDRATESEIADYAFSLHRSGATSEAESLFEKIQESSRPETLLYRSIIDFSLWKYETAAALLEKYIEHDSISAYQRLIGQLNLASAYLQLGLISKTKAILDSIPKDKSSTSNLVLGLMCEIEMQLSFLEGDFASVREQILIAQNLIKGREDRLRVWIMKWDLLTRMKASRITISEQDRMEFQKSAAKLQSWEQLRDFDFHRLSFLPDSNLLSKLYFGTPYSGFTRRLDPLRSSHLNDPKSWIWYPNAGLESGDSSSPEQVFDLRTGSLNGSVTEGPQSLEVSGQLLALMRSLCSDLYRPPKIGTLFSALFPDEHYSPAHSPNRVHQAVYRFNSLFDDAGVAVRISATKGNYFLELGKGLAVKLYRESLPSNKTILSLQDYREQVRTESFCLLDFISHSKQPKRSAQRTLQEGVKVGTVVKIGVGKKTRYRFSA